ncbi:MAG: alpha/beta fold hydrolase [Hyphomicrobiales bacterium]
MSETGEQTDDPSRIWRDVHYTVHDGLRLYARDYGDRKSTRLPVICLAGLTRNSRDFDTLATHLSQSRRVLVPDYRGRGRSDYARDWTTYTPTIEIADTLSLMALAGVDEAAVIGTSRGGILAMLMAALRPAALKAVVLNDIGPEIASEGLLRIRGYLQHAPKPATWADAEDILRTANPGFKGMSDEDWAAFARRTFRSVNGKPKADFDPNLYKTFVSYDDIVHGRVPKLWPQFAAMDAVPTLAIRGENSDLLTPETVDRMKQLMPRLRTMTVRDRGHAPFLDEPKVVAAIEQTIEKAERRKR